MAKRLGDFLVKRKAKNRRPLAWQLEDRVTFTWKRTINAREEVIGIIKDIRLRKTSQNSYLVCWVDENVNQNKTWWVQGKDLRWPND